LAAGLIRALRERVSDIQVLGIAGPAMQAAGCHVWEPFDRLAVMGFPEIVRRYRELSALRRRTIEYFRRLRPHVFIGVDTPEFNLGVEVGQLLFIACILPLAALGRRAARRWPRGAGQAPAYAIGSVAVWWTLERVVACL